MSMVGTNLPEAFGYLNLAAWACFEGGWVIIASALWFLLARKQYSHFILFAGAVGLAAVSCLVVDDISRAASFAYPLLWVALGTQVVSTIETRRLRMVTGAGAAVSLLVPNFELIFGETFKWLPSLTLYVLEHIR